MAHLESLLLRHLTRILKIKRIVRWQQVAILFSGRRAYVKNQDTSRMVELHRNIIREFGFDLDSMTTFLDFGCGAGETVFAYRRAGYNAFGCDIELEQKGEFLRLMDKTTNRIPFEDASFDFVFSDQVFEHVQDHLSALAEIWRVLKPRGISLHSFPSKLKPIESHVFVPVAGVLQNYPWLLFWAFLGVRNSFQARDSFKEVADKNFAYLRTKTRYLSKAEIIKAVSFSFDNIVFAEQYLIKHGYGKSRHIYPIINHAPFIVSLYSTLNTRVIFFQKNVQSQET